MKPFTTADASASSMSAPELRIAAGFCLFFSVVGAAINGYKHGGALSHAALMVRELGLSALIGCAGCSELPDGLRVELDTRLGRLRPC